MIDLLAYWYLLPTGMLIASIYSSTGISGANFWVLVYVLGLGLEPRLAFWLSLLSMLGGSLGGLAAHLRQRTIRARLAGGYLLLAVPAAAVGTLVSARLPGGWLLALFGIFLLLQAGRLAWRAAQPVHPRHPVRRSPAVAGGFLTGLISVGTGELLLPYALDHPAVKRPAEAAGTTLVAVFAASLTAALLRLEPELVATLTLERGRILSILLWVLPGVLAGAQLGPWIARRFDRRTMTFYIAALLLVVGTLLLWRSYPP